MNPFKLTINQIYFIIAPALFLACDVIFRTHSFGYYAKGGWVILALITLVAFIVGACAAAHAKKSPSTVVGNAFLCALVAATACRLIVVLCDFIYLAGYTKPAIVGAILVSAIIAFCYSTARDDNDDNPAAPQTDEDDDEVATGEFSGKAETQQLTGRIGGRITLY